MHAGFTGALLAGVGSPHTQQAQCGYATGAEKRHTQIFFMFLSNGRCFDGDVFDRDISAHFP